MKDPGRYRGRHVSVAGMVTYSGSLAGRGLYRIVDGEAELWVASKSGVPRKGTCVLVTGRIYDAYDVRGLPLRHLIGILSTANGLFCCDGHAQPGSRQAPA